MHCFISAMLVIFSCGNIQDPLACPVYKLMRSEQTGALAEECVYIWLAAHHQCENSIQTLGVKTGKLLYWDVICTTVSKYYYSFVFGNIGEKLTGRF